MEEAQLPRTILTTQLSINNFSFMKERRRAGVGVVMTGFGSCSSRKPAGNLLRRTKGEFLRSTRVCTLVLLALTGQGGTSMAEDLL